MNILVIGKFYTEGFAQHIAETLDEMGHKVLPFEPGLSYSTRSGKMFQTVGKVKAALYELYAKTPRYQENVNNTLLKLASQANIDLTLVCHDFLTPKQVLSIKSATRSPVVLWFPDHVGAFGRSMFLNCKFDFLFFKDPYIVKILKDELSKPSYFLPECCNPNYHKKIILSQNDYNKYKADLSTAGNLHPNRISFFDQLTDFDVKIWGNLPPHWADTSKINKFLMNRFVANEEKSKSFIASKIVLNNLQPAEIWGTNVRTFEISAAGAFQLVSHRAGLKQLYLIDEEIVSFKTSSELLEKIKFYLEHPSERDKIAMLGYKRTHSHHTYKKRLQLLIDTVFNGKRGFSLEEIYL